MGVMKYYDDKEMPVQSCTSHHIIDTGGRHLTLYFSIDFEPVQLHLTEEITEYIFRKGEGYSKEYADWLKSYYRPSFPPSLNQFFWQKIIDFCCELLGKEKRDVIAIKSYDKLQPCGNKVAEWIDSGNGFKWEYVMYTKTYHFNKFYHRWEVINNSGDKTKFHEHFQNVYKILKEQGLSVGNFYWEPTPDMIDKMIKNFLNENN